FQLIRAFARSFTVGAKLVLVVARKRLRPIKTFALYRADGIATTIIPFAPINECVVYHNCDILSL
ncbi:MAG: hypothetical protein FWE55_05370, partial [Synergistaceae bacterium]|nr:hypothetical protein [Synergistaceae bacterium]